MARIQYFSTFRTDIYAKHMNSAHPQKWELYQKLVAEDDREAFFGVSVPFQDTLRAHFELGSPKLCIMLRSSIVEDVIGELLFHPDDAQGMIKQRAQALFKLDDGGYRVQIKTPNRFRLLVGAVALGTSFRMAARIVQLVRDETGMSVYSSCSDTLASSYCRIICASALQRLSVLLQKCTGFSLALDSSTLHGLSYLDVRVRILIGGRMQNFHSLALPLYDAHTGGLMCSVLAKLLSAVCERWRISLVGVSTDGKAKMTGRKRGLATLIEKETAPRPLIRIWCGLHQLDLVMQKVYEVVLNDSFLSKLTKVIGHLRRQHLLITKWLSMFACTKWLTTNTVRVQEHFRTRQPLPSLVPDAGWWAFHFALNALTQEASIVFARLQGLSTLLTQQKATLEELASTYMTVTGMKGPLQPEEIARLPDEERNSLSESSGYVLWHKDAEAYLIELDTSIEAAISALTLEDKEELVDAVAHMFVSAVSGIHSIVAERDSNNTADSQFLLVLPRHLVCLRMPDFNRLFERHRTRLRVVLEATTMHQIGQEFVQL